MSDLLSTPVFSVLAGPEMKPFAAHAGILSKSDTLKALVEGKWKDSLDRQVKLEDWDPDTVGCCLEWLYSGDYKVPLPELPTVGRASTATCWRASAEDLQNTGGSVEASKSPPPLSSISPTKESLPLLAGQHFNGKPYQRQPSSLESLEMHMKKNKLRVKLSTYTASLFAHANIYCIASYLLLPDLQALAFHNLKTILLFSDRRTEELFTAKRLASLTTNVYVNRSRPESGEEPLQKLLSTFITTYAASLGDQGKNTISDLMREGGDLAADVWSKTSEHANILMVYAATLEAENLQHENNKRKGNVISW